MPEPYIYGATTAAALAHPGRTLKGNRKSAQQYVDKVTRSRWWSDHGVLPSRIWVREVSDLDVGALALWDEKYELRGKRLPLFVVGHQHIYGERPAVADPWVLLHEIGHFMSQDLHGKHFVYCYLRLVHRWLGQDAADVLLAGCKEWGVRINYRYAKRLITSLP